jgi:Flp pilus assembly protein TadG
MTRLDPDERGASMVEFALVAPLLFMLLFGIITGGIALSHNLQLATAAREAARYGATIPENQYGVGDGTDWASAVANEARSRAVGDLGTTGATVCVALVSGISPTTVYSPSGGSAYFYSSTGAAAAPCFSDGGTDGTVRVQVLVTMPDHIQAVLYNQSLTLSSQGDARFEYQ